MLSCGRAGKRKGVRRTGPAFAADLHLGMPSLLRFLRAYTRPGPGVVEAHATTYERAGKRLPATVYRPVTRHRAPLPAWVVLHGLTYSGREHPGLIRFASAVAAAGNVVLVPDIPEWRALRIAPALTVDTIRAAVRALQQRGDIDHARTALFGFSFGATQALVAAADPETGDQLHGVAAWGGYSDIRRVFRFGMTGQHELDGATFRARPDPYGLWIMAGNYLAQTPGYGDCGDVAEAVHKLALEAGRRRVHAGDPTFDADKRDLRQGLRPAKRALFDLIAPATSAPPPVEESVLDLSERMATAAITADPLVDPHPFLGQVRVPVLLAHGRDDQLIPWTETIRLGRGIPAASIVDITITGLFEHSGGSRRGLAPFARALESLRFLRLLRQVLHLPVRREGLFHESRTPVDTPG
jgi:pimeloyl-ACP methyl ester carboxylesterase